MKNKSKKIILVIGITILLVTLGIVMPLMVKGDNNDATAAQVLSGKTFTNGSAVAVVGQMADYSDTLVTKSVEALNSNHIETIELEPGYYTSIQMDTTAVYEAGYAAGLAAGQTTHTTTYTFASGDTGGTKDLGVNHSYRYVNASNVYAKGKTDGAATKHTGTLKIQVPQTCSSWIKMIVSINGSQIWTGYMGDADVPAYPETKSFSISL